MKWFFEKDDAIPLHGIEPGGGGIDILAKNLTGINHVHLRCKNPITGISGLDSIEQ